MTVNICRPATRVVVASACIPHQRYGVVFVSYNE
jgi:hypothetical protein